MAESFKCAYTELVELHKLQENPRNANRHPEKQIDLLAKIIDYQGQRVPIVVSKRSGFITKGHGRLLAIQKLGWTKAAVDFQDYENEAQEYADLIADNKIAELSEHDDSKMFIDLKEIPDLDLEKLGIPDLQIPELGKTDPFEEWQDMPEFIQEDKTAYRQLIINFQNDDDVKKFSLLIEQNLTEKTKSIWFPKAEIGKAADKSYE